MTVDLRTVVGAGARLDSKFSAFFRHRRVGNQVLLTNYEGQWLLVTDAEFGSFARGDVAVDTPLYARLRGANLVRAEYDVAQAVARLRSGKAFLHRGPSLHVFAVTLRSSASQADGAAVQADMSAETAERCVDFVLRSTSPSVTIEFRGGEPLINFAVVQHAIEYAHQKSAAGGKPVAFSLVSDLSLMDEEKLAFLVKHEVRVRTRLDGPEALHDAQHALPGVSAYQVAAKWIARLEGAYADAGLAPTAGRVEARLAATRATLSRAKDVVDTYVALGRKSIFLQPSERLGVVDPATGQVELGAAEFLEFYRQATDYLLDLNKAGGELVERYSAIFLKKILTGEDSGFHDLRSPGGAGIGQLAYGHDGRIYTCDEGRALAEAGDASFLLGDVRTSTYREVTGHTTVRALAIASQRDSQPDCVDCAYNPYCGVSAIRSHQQLGSLWGAMRLSALCAVHKGIQDYLFAKLAEGDADTLRVLHRWASFEIGEPALPAVVAAT